MSQPRKIVITGISRGLGAALSRRFQEAGHTVIGCGRSIDAIERIGSELGSPHRADVVDVVDDQAVALWAKDVLDAVGPPDLLINNAATINRNASLWDVPAEEFSQVIDINIKGVTNVIRHFVPAMIDAGSGIVINLSSGWGRSVSAEVAPYCATKWAIEGLTKAMAAELPSGMAAIPLNPGVIDTEMLRSCWGESAGGFPDAESWSHAAAEYILSLGPSDNGKSLSV